MADAKKLFIKTYGCQMNVYDSERMAEAMGAEGYVQTDGIEDADMVLLNTCHIREKASEKLYSDLGRLKPLKAEQARAEDRRRRLRGPGRGRRDPAPDAAGRSRRRPAGLSPAAQMVQAEGPRWWTPNFPPRTSSTTCPSARRCAAPPPS
jgi:hypothetical protein